MRFTAFNVGACIEFTRYLKGNFMANKSKPGKEKKKPKQEKKNKQKSDYKTNLDKRPVDMIGE